jgi:hypothetical protein
MTYTSDQIQAVSSIAMHVGDPWMIGMEATRIKRAQHLTDKDIMFILRNDYDREVAESTIQSTRVMYSIFGDERVPGCGFSHHHVATIEARTALGLRGIHDLSEDEVESVRIRAVEILEAVKDACGPEPTVLEVRRFLREMRGVASNGEGGSRIGVAGADARTSNAAGKTGSRSSAPRDLPADPGTSKSVEGKARSKANPIPCKEKHETAKPSVSARGQQPGTSGSGSDLVRQLERQIARASEGQRKKLLACILEMVQTTLASMDPRDAADLVAQHPLAATEAVSA